MMISRIGILGIVLASMGQAAVRAAAIEGQVYVDTNQNGQADAGEPGVAGVAVSDGRRVAASDASGRYRLDVDQSPSLVWICVPRDHAAAGPFWRWTEGRGPENFALRPRPQASDFCFLQITDTHVGRDDLVRQFVQRADKLPVPVAFVVNTGDLVGGVDVVPADMAQQQYDRYIGATAACPVPLFNVPGNHEHVSINVKEADKGHPLYGKGLYRKLLGPTYYSWDWADTHFVALDGTSLPYRERLGPEQLDWLKADLALQPADKSLVLFCHQSIPRLADASELAAVLRGRKVLAGFCGHLHSTFTTALEGIPVYHTGAMSGSWWSGPNPDGTPQGFRLVQIKQAALKTAYAGREGTYPLSVASPLASAVQSGRIEVEVEVLDFGRPVRLEAQFAGQAVPLQSASREELWATWKGTVDTTAAFDGDRPLKVTARLDNERNECEMRYLVVNGRPESYQAGAPATLKMQLRGVNAADEVLLNGKPLATIAADTPNDATLAWEIPADRLGKANRVTVRAVAEKGTNLDDFSVGPVWLEYKKARIHDLRYPSFERYSVGDANPTRDKPERDIYLCLP